MNTFLSCDWGTSSFRLTLATLPALEVGGAVRHDQGIGDTHKLWKEGGGDEATRLHFFIAVIRNAITEIEQKLAVSTTGVPVVISGMASSSIGMINLPYADLPFAADGSGLRVHAMNATDDFPHDVLLISGVRSADDVMRGEETQLIGAVPDGISSDRECLFVFPGTHSKHIRVRNGSAFVFKTYMTGEFFRLLSLNSILADAVRPGGAFSQENLRCFEEGVLEGSQNNLLNSVFHIRTSALLEKHTKEMNYFYLSGLLIGAEIADIGTSALPIIVVGGEPIVQHYERAMRLLGLQNIRVVSGDRAILKGHARILELVSGQK